MKRIIPIAVFLVFINVSLWMVKEPSAGLLLNRVFVPLSSILVLTMIILVEYYRRRSLGRDKKRPRKKVEEI